MSYSQRAIIENATAVKAGNKTALSNICQNAV
jgi:hypothetical protein